MVRPTPYLANRSKLNLCLGQHNDSRMNIALIMSAVKLGATVANYCEVTDLHRSDASGRLEGVRVRDALTGEEWNVRAKGIINATGPFTDALLSMDDPTHKPIVQASSGIHITLPNYYSPRRMGLLDPATSDGRIIFFLPWEGNTIAGTTDSRARVERDPRASEDDIRWVLEEVRRYLSPDIRVRRGDVLSAWSGLRPLVKNVDTDGKGTQGLVRSHMVTVSKSGLVTVAGGKWTTYRKMAEEGVDEAVRVFGLEGKVKSGCVTESLRLVGSDGWSRNMFIGLIQRVGAERRERMTLVDACCSMDLTLTLQSICQGIMVIELGPFANSRRGRALLGQFMESDSRHRILVSSTLPCCILHSLFYSTRFIRPSAHIHTELPINPNYIYLSPPYLVHVAHSISRLMTVIEAEIRYAVRHEYAQTAIDVLARRTRLAFLNTQTALRALPQVVDIMSDELRWTRAERQRQVRAAVAYFETMGLVPAEVAADAEKREKELVSGVLRELEPKGWVEKVERGLENVFAGAWSLLSPKGLALGREAAGVGTIVGGGEHVGPFKKAYGRATFGAGEVVALRNAFVKRANVDEENQPCVGVKDLVEIMHEVPGYEGVKDQDLKYVLEENGMATKNRVDFDEFLEVSRPLPGPSVPNSGAI